ncbi:hypothetical protein [Endozoicomonas sp. 8E]|uniref:hypothetical protein n=1 Tax=Endozoicomonas sp. 8E TaxID=3035692 RepID=UPI0029392C0C|nr:hypothetical protein [Endozoicomonas sp. 8E]WOG25813.1 hypothetical protein P6910_14645 [Endozoicomonas sp. 8E]
MRIQLLRQREDFEQGFIRALSQFLQDYLGWSGKMSWDKNTAGAVFVANDYLNVIYPNNLPRERLYSLTREFSYNPIWFRRKLQQAYIYGAVRRPFESFATSAQLIIENCPPELHNWVFIPGNHSHRAVDVANECCFVFYKPGFNPLFTSTDAEIRLNNRWLPSPTVLELSPSKSWYIEQRIRALPLNRLGDKNTVDEALAIAHKAMARLYDESSTVCLLSDYLVVVDQAIKDVFNAVEPSLSRELIIRLSNYIKNLQSALSVYADHKVELASTHGDFQPANLLYDHGKCWIIDWEYADKRCRTHDALCYGLMSRFSTGIAQRYHHLLHNPELLKAVVGWSGIGSVYSHKLLLPLFLLEECLVKLKEVASESITDKEVTLRPWLSDFLLIRQFV